MFISVVEKDASKPAEYVKTQMWLEICHVVSISGGIENHI